MITEQENSNKQASKRDDGSDGKQIAKWCYQEKKIDDQMVVRRLLNVYYLN